MVQLWPCTVHFTTKEALLYFSSPHSHKELISPVVTQKPKGFCMNKKCIKVDESHRINGQRLNNKYSTSDSTEFSCPNCNYALYWTRKWREE